MTAVYVTFEGERVKLAELCRRFGVDRQTVAYRLKKGMALRDALTKKKRRYPKHVTRGSGPSMPPPREPDPEPARPTLTWCQAIEETTNVRLANGPVVDDAAQLITELMAVVEPVTTTRQRLLVRGRHWLQRVGWQR